MERPEDKDASGLRMSEQAKRLTDAMRKRLYRAKKRNELINLESKERVLRARLVHLKANMREQGFARLVADNLRLRTQINECNDLLYLLSQWVEVNQHPQRDLSNRTTWIETTLLAHPITRRQGIQWLSERVYHQASHCLPFHQPYQQQMDAANVVPLTYPSHHIKVAFSLKVHVSYDIDEEGPTVAAMETRYEYTMNKNFDKAAYIHWDALLRANSIISKELIERVDDRFMYYHHRNHQFGTHILSIAGHFKQHNRVVITNCYIAQDELFHHPRNVLRPHGFSWTVFDDIAPGLTRVHNFAIQYTPKTTNGKVIPLSTIGRIFGRPPLDSQSRHAYIEQIRTAAESAYVGSHIAIAHELSARRS
ncbi:hypothetical protein AeMF1_004425 [Aphanomyces euteiches]|nr:hypothetical protein AeMF1_004425 [Aphanomyces euteiches]KAH9184720.1 hypothetical protein AeNC1_013304 [Aphanomyces euteiches]